MKLHITLAKMALRHLKRKDLAEILVYPKIPDVGEKIATKVLKPEDRAKLIREAPTLQDRLIIELLDETGGRKGELYKLRIRDVQFENIGERQTAILQLSGKTGTRRRRVYECVPDLRAQINNHPRKSDPDATLLLAKNGNAYTIDMFYHTVTELGKHILERPIHPHMFRHTRCTEDSRFYTDREMMKMFGWKTPQMVGVYSHLSMRDVDEKDLVLHGLKKKEEILQPIMQIRRCPKCNYENAPIAIYCGECGIVMGQPIRPAEIDQRLVNAMFLEIKKNPKLFLQAMGITSRQEESKS